MDDSFLLKSELLLAEVEEKGGKTPLPSSTSKMSARRSFFHSQLFEQI